MSSVASACVAHDDMHAATQQRSLSFRPRVYESHETQRFGEKITEKLFKLLTAKAGQSPSESFRVFTPQAEVAHQNRNQFPAPEVPTKAAPEFPPLP
jgi:hypothetical protein